MSQMPPTAMLNALQGAAKPAGAGPAPPMAPGAAPPIPSATGAPPPIGIGKQPTGAGSANSKVVVGTVINGLRDLKAQYPESGEEIEAMIAQVRGYGSGGADALKKPTPPGGGDDA